MTPLLLAAAAFVLRAALIPTRFPYADDLLQLYAVTRPTVAEAARAAAGIGPLQPPLDYAVDWLAARVTHDLSVLRLLPALWGALAAAAAWRLGVRLRGKSFGLWWGACVALSMPHVSYSVTLRSYSLAVLLGLVAWLAFEDVLDGKEPGRFALAQSLFQLAWPHAWLAGLAQLGRAALDGRKTLKRTALALAPSWAVLAVWLAAWHFAVPSEGGFHYDVPLSSLVSIVRTFCQGIGPGLFVLPFLACAAAALAGRERAFRAGAFQLLPLAAIFAAHRAESVLLLPRHALPLLPAWLGLAALGAERLGKDRLRAGFVALLLAWAAWTPLAALASRETALSAALAESAASIRTLGRDREPVYADPNTGATVLYALDRTAFDRLAGIAMRDGFAFFRFPAGLRTLCFADPALATIDRAGLAALKKAGRKTLLVDLDGLNAAPRPEPFEALGLRRAALVERAPGIYTEDR